MEAMTVKEFDSLQWRHFGGSRVRDSIRTALEEREKQRQKPTVTEKEISSAIYAGRNWDDGKFYDKDGIEAVKELFKSKGFEINE